MTLLIKTLAAVAAGIALATSAFAQSAREIRGASPYVDIGNELAPKLIVDPPLSGPLAQGIFQAQYKISLKMQREPQPLSHVFMAARNDA